MTCPRCGADVWWKAETHTDYSCGTVTWYSCGTVTWPNDIEQSVECKLRQIAALCRRHANPASNVGAHALAKRILKIVEPQGE